MLYLVIMLFVLIYLSNFYFQCFLRFIVLLLTFWAGFRLWGDIVLLFYRRFICKYVMLKIDTVWCWKYSKFRLFHKKYTFSDHFWPKSLISVLCWKFGPEWASCLIVFGYWIYEINYEYLSFLLFTICNISWSIYSIDFTIGSFENSFQFHL